MPAGPLQNAPDDIEPVGAAVESELRLGTALARQSRHALRIDIGRIGNDQVVARLAERPEKVAAVQLHPVFETVVGDIARCNIEGVAGIAAMADAKIIKRHVEPICGPPQCPLIIAKTEAEVATKK